jgi:hypothetical protein
MIQEEKNVITEPHHRGAESAEELSAGKGAVRPHALRLAFALVDAFAIAAWNLFALILIAHALPEWALVAVPGWLSCHLSLPYDPCMGQHINPFAFGFRIDISGFRQQGQRGQ